MRMGVFAGRIGIIGAGALGCFYGARLARAGANVHFLMRSDYEVVRAQGLMVYSRDGDFLIEPPVFPDAETMGPCDLVIVGLKTTDNGHLARLLAPTVHKHTIVLTLQNGLGNEETIAAAIAKNLGISPGAAASQVVGGVAFLCSHRPERGVVCHTDHGWVRMAELDGPSRQRTHDIAELFRTAGIDCQVFESLKLIRWEKLVWNIPFNGMGVAAGHAHTAAILADDMLLATARGLMQEVVDAAAGDGVALAPDIVERMINNTRTMGDYRSSMQIDFEAGRPLEVEAILGEPVRRALAANVSVPRMQMLYGAVRRLDALKRLIQV